MNNQLKAGLVRVLMGGWDVPLGVGFLISDKHVLTCAHVIAQVLSIPPDTPMMPTQTIRLEFPFVTLGTILTARVVRWYPVQFNASHALEDIAILELESITPEAVRPLRLVTADDVWGDAFRAFGFPEGHDEGVWASGELRDSQTGGWVQIEDTKVTGHRVMEGFSGGPVWDEHLGGVVGMVVAADTLASVKVASIIPSALLIEAWPELEQQAIPPCPYRGLFVFREEDASYFFGREKFTLRLSEDIQRKSMIAVVIGPSGSGKSSVVFAGLLPLLHQQQHWSVGSFRPGSQPFNALAAALQLLLEPEMTETDRLLENQKLANALNRGDIEIHDVIARILEKNWNALRILLIADQFEELYTLCSVVETRQRFLEVLLKEVELQKNQHTAQFSLVLTLRADFLGQVSAYRPFTDFFRIPPTFLDR